VCKPDIGICLHLSTQAIQETEADEAAAFDTSSPEEDLARSCTDIRRDLREAIEKAMAEGYHSAFDTDSAAGSRSACSVSPMMPQGLDGDGEARCEEDCESASTASSEEPALVSEERPKRLGAMSMRAGAGLYSLAVGRVRTESSLGWMAAVSPAHAHANPCACGPCTQATRPSHSRKDRVERWVGRRALAVGPCFRRLVLTCVRARIPWAMRPPPPAPII
jgi:hypothetical protein